MSCKIHHCPSNVLLHVIFCFTVSKICKNEGKSLVFFLINIIVDEKGERAKLVEGNEFISVMQCLLFLFSQNESILKEGA